VNMAASSDRVPAGSPLNSFQTNTPQQVGQKTSPHSARAAQGKREPQGQQQHADRVVPVVQLNRHSLLASFWVLAHDPQQSMVTMHMTTATQYESTTTMLFSVAQERPEPPAPRLDHGSRVTQMRGIRHSPERKLAVAYPGSFTPVILSAAKDLHWFQVTQILSAGATGSASALVVSRKHQESSPIPKRPASSIHYPGGQPTAGDGGGADIRGWRIRECGARCG
jgi:hypothetical protein